MVIDVDIHETEGITGKGRSALWLLSGQLGSHRDSLIDVTRAQTSSRPAQSKEASALESEALQETLGAGLKRRLWKNKWSRSRYR
jgi:hypothetical protein